MERNLTFRLKVLLKILLVLLVLPVCVFAQDDDEWPSLSYLRSDYKAVAAVAHIRIKEAEITNRIIHCIERPPFSAQYCLQCQFASNFIFGQ